MSAPTDQGSRFTQLSNELSGHLPAAVGMVKGPRVLALIVWHCDCSGVVRGLKILVLQ